ncbi:MAG: hypothetical protein ACOX3R_06755 [Desulfitobacteriia bacterium]|jgi:hypothetical protein
MASSNLLQRYLQVKDEFTLTEEPIQDNDQDNYDIVDNIPIGNSLDDFNEFVIDPTKSDFKELMKSIGNDTLQFLKEITKLLEENLK